MSHRGLHPLEGVCIKATSGGTVGVNLSQGGLHPPRGVCIKVWGYLITQLIKRQFHNPEHILSAKK